MEISGLPWQSQTHSALGRHCIRRRGPRGSDATGSSPGSGVGLGCNCTGDGEGFCNLAVGHFLL